MLFIKQNVTESVLITQNVTHPFTQKHFSSREIPTSLIPRIRAHRDVPISFTLRDNYLLSVAGEILLPRSQQPASGPYPKPITPDRTLSLYSGKIHSILTS